MLIFVFRDLVVLFWLLLWYLTLWIVFVWVMVVSGCWFWWWLCLFCVVLLGVDLLLDCFVGYFVWFVWFVGLLFSLCFGLLFVLFELINNVVDLCCLLVFKLYIVSVFCRLVGDLLFVIIMGLFTLNYLFKLFSWLIVLLSV